MKVRKGVFLFGTVLGFDGALVLQVGGLKIPLFIVDYVRRQGSGTVISGMSSFCCIVRNGNCLAASPRLLPR
jgi:hypothetical protein